MEQFRISRAVALSFKYWMRNFIPFTLLAAVAHAPLLLRFTTVEIDPRYIATATSSMIPSLLTYWVVQELNGSKVSMWTSIRLGLRGLPPAMFLGLGLLFVIGKLPIAGILVASIAICVYFVVGPAAVAERLNPLRAFPRSAELTRGRRWRIYGLCLLLGVISQVTLLIWSVASVDDELSRAMASVEASSISYWIVNGLFELYFGIVQAVSYALLRQDKDGTSVAELARVFA